MALNTVSRQRLSNLQFLPTTLSPILHLDVQQEAKTQLLVSLFSKPIAFPVSLHGNPIIAQAKILQININSSLSICQTFNPPENSNGRNLYFFFLIDLIIYPPPLKTLQWFSISLSVKVRSLQWPVMSCLVYPAVTFLTLSSLTDLIFTKALRQFAIPVLQIRRWRLKVVEWLI